MSKFTSQYPQREVLTTVTIANGARITDFYLGGQCLVGVYFPATMTNASFNLLKSLDGGATYKDVVSNLGSGGSSQIVIDTEVDKVVMLQPADCYALSGWIRLYGNTSNEAAARTLIIVSRAI
jgi:hypothetical protein